MTAFALLAFASGLLIGLSRQINGRLSLSGSPLRASFWNHLVGLAVLSMAGVVVGGLWPVGPVPVWAWFGGPLGVLFVASGSWLIARIGAANTALLVIAGQMVTGVLLDLVTAAPGPLWPRALGVVMILTGAALMHRPARG